MYISTEINLVGKSAKKQLLEVEKILNSFSNEEKIILIDSNPSAKSSFALTARWFSEAENPTGTLLSTLDGDIKTTLLLSQREDKYLDAEVKQLFGTVINRSRSIAFIRGRKKSG